MKKENQRNSLKNITKRMFRTQMVLILTLAIFLGAAGIFLNIYFEQQKRDHNLINIAEAIAQSPITLQGTVFLIHLLLSQVLLVKKIR